MLRAIYIQHGMSTSSSKGLHCSFLSSMLCVLIYDIGCTASFKVLSSPVNIQDSFNSEVAALQELLCSICLFHDTLL